MKTETFHLELITPCFCGGAEPEKQAEIRAPSIRGQLRWWFRTLGGFKSLAPMPVRDQEVLIFGTTAGDQGRAGKLIVRVNAPDPSKLRTTATGNANTMNAQVGTERGYLLFPLRTQTKGVFKSAQLPAFDLIAHWRGDATLWSDIQALVAVFGHLGALGFRGRRAMGALRFRANAPDLRTALDCFAKKENMVLTELKSDGELREDSCISELANWLKSWREHGRTPNLALAQPGFDHARRDHNEGLKRLGVPVTFNPPGRPPKGSDGETFRPALGLPIIQFFSSQPKGAQNKVNWDWGWNRERRKGEGRFASPVLLRPHKDAQGNWHALVIFVDAHRWPNGKQVFLNGQPRKVSLELYEKMKTDPRLHPFP